MTIGRIPSVEGGIQPTIVDAKGDLIAGVAADSVNRLAVGTNGTVLTADSSTSTGLAWTGVNQMANPVINGGMDIWQRGTSVSLAASTSVANSYIFDRFQMPTNANQACTVSRQTVSDSTNLPNIQYAARIQRNSGQTGTGNLNPSTSIESANSIPFAGKAITLSFYARAGANYSATSSALPVTLVSGTGTDQNVQNGLTSQTTVASGTVTLTTTWQRFVVTGTVGSTATQLAMFWTFTPTGTAGTNDWFELTGVQIDIGTYTASTAPTFRRSGGTIQGELAACQRYYYRNTPGSAYGQHGFGSAYSTTQWQGLIQLPVTMRITPTTLESGNVKIADGANTPLALTLSLVSSQSSPTVASVQAVVTGATQYRPYFLQNDNNTAGYVGFSAEL